ncbi:zinc-binding dehydrogenase [Sphingobium subterraneum]|uniref:NADPH:quinone reductase-like Zn-dependent oxidoreductase n=1 Tax=Sphingobium subterraneum TaxID=627688 RepID=A0A841J028_9SPHN|nr:zinc-binding dehydrogenase [Sphingobium subterraneum]MBB6123712.1 NADPH:quinone reductase-like Zn-dependent oxidoreductase [Sphingobium subterraneum]
MALHGRELRSTIDESGVLTLSLEDVTLSDPAEDEIIVQVEAAPINPSDLGMMLSAGDIASLTSGGTSDRPFLTLHIPESRMAAVRGRIGQSVPIGNEGAGTVIAAGSAVRELEGKRVGMIGGAMYADYRKISARDVIPLPDGASAADGAAMFVNPLTALGFVETARNEGHTAIVHTAAASNLGQMLQKICLADGIPLVNIVRSEEQAQILRGIGAHHVLNSGDSDFRQQLAEALEQTGATIAFDAIGGGTLGSTILQAMESVAVGQMSEYSRYGSERFKQLYIYGALDPAPTVLNRLAFGFQWDAGGWLLFPFLRKIGPEVAQRLRSRVVDELTTTFASHYTRTISLSETLQPDILRAYERKATGEKYLIDPTQG